MNKTLSSRLGYIDFLKFVGLTGIIIAHVGAPEKIMMLRNFDVPLMVIISAILGNLSFHKYADNKILAIRYCFDRIKRLVFPTWIFLIIYFSFLLLEHRVFSFEYYFHSFTLTRYGVNYVWIVLIYLYSALLIPLFNKIKTLPWSWGCVAVLYLLYEIMYYFEIGINNKFVDTTFYYIIPYGALAYLGFCYPLFNRNKKIAVMIIAGITFIALGIYYCIQNGSIQNVQIAKYPPRLYYLGYGITVSFLLLAICGRKPLKLFENKIIIFISRHSMWIYLWHILMLEVYAILKLPEIWYIKLLTVYIASILMVVFVNSLLNVIEKRKSFPLFKYLRY